MKTYIVILEKFGHERAKRVKVQANSDFDAMAAAQIKYRGWHPVDAQIIK